MHFHITFHINERLKHHALTRFLLHRSNNVLRMYSYYIEDQNFWQIGSVINLVDFPYLKYSVVESARKIP